MKTVFLFAFLIASASGLICSNEEKTIARDDNPGKRVMVDYIQNIRDLDTLFEHINYVDRERQLPFFMNFNKFHYAIGACKKGSYFVRDNVSTESIVISGCELLKKRRFILSILSSAFSENIIKSKNFSSGFNFCRNQSTSGKILETLRNCDEVSIDMKACIEYGNLPLSVCIYTTLTFLVVFCVFAFAYNVLQKFGMRSCNVRMNRVSPIRRDSQIT